MSFLRLAPLAVCLAACGSGEKTPEEENGAAPQAQTPEGSKLPTFVPPPELGGSTRKEVDFDLEWESLDRDDKGERDTFEVARWVTERSKEAGKAVSDRPPRVSQAIDLLNEILDKVPDSSKDRRLLGECYFFCAAWWFKSADTVAWEHLRLVQERTLPRADRDSPVVVLDQKAIDKLIKEYTDYSAKANKQVRALAEQGLDQFARYHALRPDDKMIYDYVWKLYFYLQNYSESLKWLDALLREMEAVDFHWPGEGDYLALRNSMRDELATMKIQGRQPTSTANLISTLTDDSLGRSPREGEPRPKDR